MKARTLFSEAGRNIVSGTSRTGLLALLLAAIAAGVGALDLATITQLQRTSVMFDRSGASTRILVSEGNVQGVSCEALPQVSGIKAAGSLKPAGSLTILAMPNHPLSTYAVTSGMAAVIGVETMGDGVWMTRDLATLLSLRPGDALMTNAGPMRIGGVFDYPEDGRDARLTYAILVPGLPTGLFDECWARGWPGPLRFDDALRWSARVAPGTSTPLVVGQLNNAHGPVYDPHAAFAERITRWAPFGAAAIAVVLGWGSVRRRRLELASALHSGQRRSDLVATALIEVGAWVGAGTVMAIGVCLMVSLDLAPMAPESLWPTQIPIMTLAAVGALAGVLVGLASVRERHLFGYFKDR